MRAIEKLYSYSSAKTNNNSLFHVIIAAGKEMGMLNEESEDRTSTVLMMQLFARGDLMGWQGGCEFWVVLLRLVKADDWYRGPSGNRSTSKQLVKFFKNVRRCVYMHKCYQDCQAYN